MECENDFDATPLVQFVSKYQFVAHTHVVGALTMGTIDSLFGQEPPKMNACVDFMCTPNQTSLLHSSAMLTNAFEVYGSNKIGDAVGKLLPEEAAVHFVRDTLQPVAVSKEHIEGLCAQFQRQARQLVITSIATAGSSALPTHSSLEQHAHVLPALSPMGIRGTSAKKSHEVERMAPYINSMVKKIISETNEHRSKRGDTQDAICEEDVIIVDVGAGQGYLSCELAVAYGWHVVALERDGVQQHGSVRRSQAVQDANQQLEAGSSAKRRGRVSMCNFDFSSSVSTDDLESAVQAAGSPVPHQRAVFVMVSLHACGSLSVNMIKVFRHWAKCLLLINVGCCYNLMAASDFPLSVKVKGVCAEHHPSFAGRVISEDVTALTNSPDAFILTKNMKMAACQAPQKFLISHGGQEALGDSLTSNAYRCVLQKLFVDAVDCDDLAVIGRVPSILRTRKRSRPSADGSSDFWNDYASGPITRAIKAPVPEHTEIKNIDAIRAAALALEGQHLTPASSTLTKLALLWASKAVLGSIIEALILYDRREYLLESMGKSAASGSVNISIGSQDAQTHSIPAATEPMIARVSMVPLFDPLQSPRFVAIVASKSFQ